MIKEGKQMARNRRNKRRNRNIADIISMKSFWLIMLAIFSVILICLGIRAYNGHQEREVIARQQEEIDKKSQQLFAAIENDISQTNDKIAHTDSIIQMSTVGDILCGQEMLDDAYNVETKKYDFSSMFRQVAGYINGADIVMGTMETNFTTGTYNGENAPKEFASAVKESGVNLVTISHNHSLDYGLEGLQNTKNTLEDLGYDVIGDNLEDNNSVLIKEVKDVPIAFLTYTYGVNNQEQKTKEELESIHIYSEKQAKKDIAYAKQQGAEYICVMIHWGDAISATVNAEQKEIADFLVENGVDLILGAHPSVVQPMEVRKNKEGKNVFIAYSIGTYISTLSQDDAKVELVLNIELRKSGQDGKVYLNKVNYTPIYVLDNGLAAENRFELIDMKSTAKAYANGNTENITKETYDKLVAGLNQLNDILVQEELEQEGKE